MTQNIARGTFRVLQAVLFLFSFFLFLSLGLDFLNPLKILFLLLIILE